MTKRTHLCPLVSRSDSVVTNSSHLKYSRIIHQLPLSSPPYSITTPPPLPIWKHPPPHPHYYNQLLRRARRKRVKTLFPKFPKWVPVLYLLCTVVCTYVQMYKCTYMYIFYRISYVRFWASICIAQHFFVLERMSKTVVSKVSEASPSVLCIMLKVGCTIHKYVQICRNVHFFSKLCTFF